MILHETFKAVKKADRILEERAEMLQGRWEDTSPDLADKIKRDLNTIAAIRTSMRMILDDETESLTRKE